MKTRIHWEEVRAQLRAREQAFNQEAAENPARLEAVFRRRAAHLARSQAQITALAPPVPALLFLLQSERYAIRLQELAEVLPFRQCTPVPGAPPGLLGVMSRRGELRPVLDLAQIIHRVEERSPGFLLMLRQPGRQIGLRVDRTEGLQELAAERVQAARQGQYADTLPGEPLVSLLNPERLLAAQPFLTKGGVAES
jgi:chemotaxis signal transduction protein